MFVGGATGALLRYGIAEAFAGHSGRWPWPTFIANLIGCAILSFAIAHIDHGRGSSVHRALIGTGFCGGLTTFSTFQLEIYDLVEAGRLDTAIAYAMTSILLGLFIVSLARRFVARGEEVA